MKLEELSAGLEIALQLKTTVYRAKILDLAPFWAAPNIDESAVHKCNDRTGNIKVRVYKENDKEVIWIANPRQCKDTWAKYNEGIVQAEQEREKKIRDQKKMEEQARHRAIQVQEVLKTTGLNSDRSITREGVVDGVKISLSAWELVLKVLNKEELAEVVSEEKQRRADKSAA